MYPTGTHHFAARRVCVALLWAGTLGVLGGGCSESPKASDESSAKAVAATPEVAPAQEALGMPTPSAVDGMSGVTGPQLLRLVRQYSKGALVNLWASWCGSCKKELPLLMELDTVYRNHGIGLLLVSADEESALPAARSLLDELQIHRPAYFIAGSVADFKRTLYPRWKGGVPATFLIDATGKVRYFWNGPVLAEEVSPVVQGFLSGEAIDGESDVAAR